MGLFAFLFVLAGPRRGRTIEDPVVLMVLGACLLVGILGAIMILAGRRHGSKQVFLRSGRVCLRCRYPLPPADDMGVCPECGDPFTHDDNLIAWRARYPGLRL